MLHLRISCGDVEAKGLVPGLFALHCEVVPSHGGSRTCSCTVRVDAVGHARKFNGINTLLRCAYLLPTDNAQYPQGAPAVTEFRLKSHYRSAELPVASGLLGPEASLRRVPGGLQESPGEVEVREEHDRCTPSRFGISAPELLAPATPTPMR